MTRLFDLAPRQWIGHLWLALFLCAQLVVGAHHALESHEVCVEHGALTHGGHHHGHAAHGAEQAPVVEPSRSVEEGEPSGREHAWLVGDEAAGHEDCHIPVLRDLQGTHGQLSAHVPCHAPSSTRALDLTTQFFGPRHDLLRMAPKQSPPRLG